MNAGRRALDSLDQEIRDHIDRETQDNIDRGMPPEDARRAAARRFGNVALVTEDARATWIVVWIEQLLQDIRIGCRALRRSPGFTMVVVLTLGLGIGANTAIFSVLNAVLMRPLPYPETDQLVQIVSRRPVSAQTQGRLPLMSVSVHDYRDYRERNTVFREMGWVGTLGDTGAVSVVGGERPERVRAMMVSSSLFSVLGIEPMLGRLWSPDADTYAFEGPRVAIISHGFWQRRFAADPGVVGRRITVDNWPHTIVAVMPPDFRIPPVLYQGRLGDTRGRLQTGDLYVPLEYNAYGQPRGTRQLAVVARLRTEVGLAQAQAELSALAEGLAQTYPDNEGWGVLVVSLQQILVGNLGPQIGMLMAAVGLVLLIACANIANLLLARGEGPRAEMAIRAAMGGGRRRLVRQMLTESLMLAVLGGMVGLSLAVWGNRMLVTLIPASVPRGAETSIDGTVLAFALLVTVGTAVLFGLAPAWRGARVELRDAMSRSSGQVTGARGPRGVSRTLVAGQVALAVVLLGGAGLLTQSFLRLARADVGYDPENVLKVSLSVGQPSLYNDTYFECDPNSDRTRVRARCQLKLEDVQRFFRGVIERVDRVPGVESAALVSNAPLTNAGLWPLRVERPPSDSSAQGVVAGSDERGGRNAVVVGSTDGRPVYPGYFQTMGIRLLRGRYFQPGDPAYRGLNNGGVLTGNVAIINQTLAQRLWPDDDPLGKRITFYGPPWMTVVGVVEDTEDSSLRDRTGDDGSLDSHVYFLGQFSYMDLMVRTRDDPMGLVEPVESAILELDPTLPVGAVTTLEQMAREDTALPRFYALMVGIFAGVALLLAAVGLYGVVAYTVSQRTREIGLRMALGASQARIRGMVARLTMGAVALGLTLGTVGAVAFAPVLGRFLYGMDPVDPVTFVGVALLLAVVALAASYLPARRASRMDPMWALRHE